MMQYVEILSKKKMIIILVCLYLWFKVFTGSEIDTYISLSDRQIYLAQLLDGTWHVAIWKFFCFFLCVCCFFYYEIEHQHLVWICDCGADYEAAFLQFTGSASDNHGYWFWPMPWSVFYSCVILGNGINHQQLVANSSIPFYAWYYEQLLKVRT